MISVEPAPWPMKPVYKFETHVDLGAANVVHERYSYDNDSNIA